MLPGLIIALNSFSRSHDDDDDDLEDDDDEDLCDGDDDEGEFLCYAKLIKSPGTLAISQLSSMCTLE